MDADGIEAGHARRQQRYDRARTRDADFTTRTAGVSLTARQPYDDVVRTAVEALSAVLGGTSPLHTNALDETPALPSERAAEIALRTRQVLMEETGVVNVADPLGGSWYGEGRVGRAPPRSVRGRRGVSPRPGCAGRRGPWW